MTKDEKIILQLHREVYYERKALIMALLRTSPEASKLRSMLLDAATEIDAVYAPVRESLAGQQEQKSA